MRLLSIMTTSLTLFFIFLFLSIHLQATILTEAATQDPSVNQVPYTTARLSRSQFNYFFPVSASPKFIRLFFYLAYYPSFPHTDASFSVQSNGFTFLKGFNASLNADTEATKTIFREYVVNVNDGEILILSFTPSQPNSYAFINGIEVQGGEKEKKMGLSLVSVEKKRRKWDFRNQRRGVATGGVACDSVACCGAGARAQQMGVHVVVLVGLRSIDEVGGDAASADMVG
ncbi:Receptor-like protein kinase FERONIA [Glycine soja]